jgi:hypothetical protein
VCAQFLLDLFLILLCSILQVFQGAYYLQASRLQFHMIFSFLPCLEIAQRLSSVSALPFSTTQKIPAKFTIMSVILTVSLHIQETDLKLLWLLSFKICVAAGYLLYPARSFFTSKLLLEVPDCAIS